MREVFRSGDGAVDVAGGDLTGDYAGRHARPRGGELAGEP